MSKTKVRTVDSVKLTIASVTGRVTIAAGGTVTTGGWSAPELIETRNAPAGANRHFDFVATPPDGPATQQISPIAATRTVQAGAGSFCVIIHAATNDQGPECIQVEIGDKP